MSIDIDLIYGPLDGTRIRVDVDIAPEFIGVPFQDQEVEYVRGSVCDCNEIAIWTYLHYDTVVHDG